MRPCSKYIDQPTNNITSRNLRIYEYQKNVLSQIVLIMANVDLDAELDQITDMQSLYKYMFGEEEANTIVEEPIACVDLDAELDQITDMPSLYKYMFGDEDESDNNEMNIVEENIIEEIPVSWIDELLEIEIYEEEIPKEYKRVVVNLGDGNMPAKVRCEICVQLYKNDQIKKHYLNMHNKVQCNKCGVLLDADDAKAIRIHNKNCYTGGFKNRNFDSNDFHIEILSALENSIVTYQCLLRRPPIEKDEIIRDDLEAVLNKFHVLATQILRATASDGDFKFTINMQATYFKALKPNDKITVGFNKGTGRALHAIRNVCDIDDNISFELVAITDWVNLFASRSSQWNLETVDCIELTCHKMP